MKKVEMVKLRPRLNLTYEQHKFLEEQYGGNFAKGIIDCIDYRMQVATDCESDNPYGINKKKEVTNVLCNMSKVLNSVSERLTVTQREEVQEGVNQLCQILLY